MNRLDFLKTLGGGALAAAAVPLLPILPKAAETIQLGFKPDWVAVPHKAWNKEWELLYENEQTA